MKILKDVVTIKTVGSIEKVLTDKTPKYEETQGACLKNARYNFQVAVKSVKRKLRCHIALDSDINEYITVREVHGVPVNYAFSEELPNDTYVLSKKSGMYPDLLTPLHDMGFALLPSQWKAFMITVTAGANGTLPVGRHKIKISISCDDDKKVIAQTDYVLEIIGEELPKLPVFNMNWMHYDCISEYYNLPVFSQEFNEITDKYIKNLMEHGGNSAFVPLFTPPLDTAVGTERKTVQLVGVTVKNGEYSFDLEPVRAFIRRVMALGMEYLEFSHLFTQWGGTACPKVMANVDGEEKRIFGWDTPSDGEEYTKFLQALLPKLVELSKEEGVKDKVFWHLTDEPNVHRDLAQYAKLKATVRALVEDMEIIDAMSEYEFYEKKLVSIPVVDTGRLHDFEGRCDKYGIYYCCGTGKNRSNRFINMPALRTRMIGFQTYYNNAVGFLHWGFNFWKSQYSLVNINPWLDNDALGAFPAGDAFIVYPGEDGPWDSIRNEIISDAWQDCRLAFLAEKYVGKAAVQKLFADNKMKKIKEYPHSEKKYMRVRERLIEIVKNRSL